MHPYIKDMLAQHSYKNGSNTMNPKHALAFGTIDAMPLHAMTSASQQVEHGMWCLWAMEETATTQSRIEIAKGKPKQKKLFRWHWGILEPM